MLGFIFWDEVPTPPLIAGSAVVGGPGLFLLLHGSRRRNRRLRAAISQMQGELG